MIWPRKSRRYSDLLRTGVSNDRIPVWAIFSAPVQIDLGALSASCSIGTGTIPLDKAARALHWPPSRSSAEVKDRLELQRYYPCVSSWPVVG